MKRFEYTNVFNNVPTIPKWLHCTWREKWNGIGLEPKVKIVRLLWGVVIGMWEGMEKYGHRWVEGMYWLYFLNPKSKHKAQDSKYFNERKDKKLWLPQKIQKWLLQECIKRYWNIDKGANRGKRTTKRSQLLETKLYFSNLFLFSPNYYGSYRQMCGYKKNVLC